MKLVISLAIAPQEGEAAAAVAEEAKSATSAESRVTLPVLALMLVVPVVVDTAVGEVEVATVAKPKLATPAVAPATSLGTVCKAASAITATELAMYRGIALNRRRPEHAITVAKKGICLATAQTPPLSLPSRPMVYFLLGYEG